MSLRSNLSHRRSLTLAFPVIAVAALATIGCGPPPAKTPAQLVVDDSRYLFDTIYGAPGTHTFTFRDPGGLPTSALSVELRGDTHAFTIATDGCTGRSIASGASCGIAVTLANDVADDYQAQLVVTDAAHALSALVDMSGKIAPAALSAAATASTLVRGSSGSGSVTITNAGGARSGTLSATVTGAGATIDSDGCGGTTLAGGATCQISIAVATTLTQAVAPTVTVSVVDARGLSVSTPISFKLVDPGLLTLSSLEFGAIDSRAQSGGFTITNPGPETTDPIKISITDVQGDPNLKNGPAFSIYPAECKDAVLAPGKSCNAYVLLSPQITLGGVYTAWLTVAADNINPSMGSVKMVAVRNSAMINVQVAGPGAGTLWTNGGILCNHAAGASAALGCGAIAVVNGQSATVTANTAAGSTFAGWTGGGCGYLSTCTVTAQNNQDVTITANFN
jgi:uncharacterized repeat protein (TIGR02543 family)